MDRARRRRGRPHESTSPDSVASRQAVLISSVDRLQLQARMLSRVVQQTTVPRFLRLRPSASSTAPEDAGPIGPLW